MDNNANPVVHVRKSFPVSKETLFQAWTEQEQLKQWWKPMNKELTRVENDLREGGTVAYHFDDHLQIKGEYKEVAGNDKLVYSWNWELPDDSMHKGEYLLTVTFSEEGNNSSLDVKQENFKSEHSVKPHEEGWEEALEGLKNYLTEKTAK